MGILIPPSRLASLAQEICFFFDVFVYSLHHTGLIIKTIWCEKKLQISVDEPRRLMSIFYEDFINKIRIQFFITYEQKTRFNHAYIQLILLYFCQVTYPK